MCTSLINRSGECGSWSAETKVYYREICEQLKTLYVPKIFTKSTCTELQQ